MATDVSSATGAQNIDPVEPVVAIDAITNSGAATSPHRDEASQMNDDSVVANNLLDSSTFAAMDAPSIVDPVGPTPIEDVVGGIQPVADFIPKDALNSSHPTPPPDRPLVTADTNGDTAMVNGHSEAQPPAETAQEVMTESMPDAQSQPVQTLESSLVRPREDDVDDVEERAAKRSRVEMGGLVENEVADLPAAMAEIAEPSAATSAPADDAMSEAVAQPETGSLDSAAPRAELEHVSEAMADAKIQAATDPQPASASGDTALPSQTEPQGDQIHAKPSTEEGAPPAADASAPGSKYTTTPMTEPQKRALVEKMKNLKKTKHSAFFLKPVDPVALNIPTYPEIIKHPMDIGTMDSKLKNNTYSSVQEFADDFELIIANSRTFNGVAHAVTQTGMSMKAYFDRMMESIPGPDQPTAPKAPKRASPARAPPRPSRPSTGPPAQPAVKSEAFALQPDGVPQPRRESNGRPARAIKPPANRDIPYAKPKRKEHQLELRFCEYVLEEMRGPRFAQINTVFLMPVDPVALNIPHYHQIIKKPMDLSTMAQKLKQGQYGRATEFEADFKLMVENCLAFNPAPNVVRDMGIQLKREFVQLWSGKNKWERLNKPESARGTSASDEESDGEEEEDEDDAPEDGKEQTIQALQQQLAGLQNLISGMTRPKSHKKRDRTKDSKRKIGSLSSAPPKTKSSAARPAPKKAAKPKQVSYAEKQEISDAVGRMDDGQVSELTRIITDNCDKYSGQEEMELEIDDLPNNVQVMLLRYTRKLFGKPKTAEAASPPDDGEMEDDDFEPSERARGGGGGGAGTGAGGMPAAAAAAKRKKQKPMSKREQIEKIEALNTKLEQFKQAGTSGSESPTGASSYNAAKAESSGDDESEESEEE
ncbi:transcription initiation at TATA-containing promoter protein [Friedmanniomyces endolithicus]|nr:transcription initiation at TATA-containing promoter protein [Friedmanniomyces endolithicus]